MFCTISKLAYKYWYLFFFFMADTEDAENADESMEIQSPNDRT